jgi:putative ATP-dependent endonuclease of OLD family
VETLTWYPAVGVNLILGGGDVGKSTVLDAIALLFSPTNSSVLSDADYWKREPEEGFSIEAIVSLPGGRGINQQSKQAWPWEWDGKDAKLPNIDEDGSSAVADPVYRLRVRGTSDFDLVYELLQPSGEVDHLPVAVRRAIGVVRLGGDDRNDRDLRLVQGSALDRLLYDKTLRARLGHKVADTDVAGVLSPEAKAKLTALNAAFEKQALPHDLGLGLATNQGQSLNALIGLTADKAGVELPLSNWGAGTRRLAALEIAAAHHGENPITVVDEVERGLEPYRLRGLLAALQAAASQGFLTTHSATALSAATKASLWYMDGTGVIGSLPAIIAEHGTRDPEALLARLTIVCEGLTEVGFVRSLLERAFKANLLDHGIWLTDGEGNERTLGLLDGLSKSGLQFGGFADDEGSLPNKWATVKERLGSLLFRWPSGCLEENIIALVAEGDLGKLVAERDWTGERMRILADRAGASSTDISSIREKRPDLKTLITEAATGAIPADKADDQTVDKKAWKRHGARWFKTERGGRELCDKCFTLNLWPQLEPNLLPFINAVRTAVGLEGLATLDP